MTDYTLSNEQKKRLTEFLGQEPDTECDHDKVPKDLNCLDRPDLECDSCQYHKLVYRSFTTPQDTHDLAKKLSDTKKWDEFEYKVDQMWLMIDSPEVSPSDWGKVAWLYLDDARFCYLVNSYLEAG
jgi:hypothetical protein